MEPTLKDFRKKLEMIQKEIDLENRKFSADIKFKIERLNAAGGNETARNYFSSGNGLRLWDLHKNKIRRIISDGVASFAEMSYYKGLISAVS